MDGTKKASSENTPIVSRTKEEIESQFIPQVRSAVPYILEQEFQEMENTEKSKKTDSTKQGSIST